MKLAIIFGGISTEHDVSLQSGTSILKNINKEKYEIMPIYIDKKGIWYEYTKDINNIEILKMGEEIKDLQRIDNTIEVLKKQDVVFPVLHGLGGEDGAIQGVLETAKVPYVGCKILASSICMDKVYTKVILDRADILQAKSEYIKKEEDRYIYVDKSFNEKVYDLSDILEIIEGSLEYPMFVKPSNFGSSVGISKVRNKEELKLAVEYASSFDRKIIVEQGINGKEVECAVLGNVDIITSSVRRNKSSR